MAQTKSYEALERELEWYKNNYSEVCEVVYKMSDVLMPGYYVGNSCNGTQCCKILADEIIKNYAPKQKNEKKDFLAQ